MKSIHPLQYVPGILAWVVAGLVLAGTLLYWQAGFPGDLLRVLHLLRFPLLGGLALLGLGFVRVGVFNQLLGGLVVMPTAKLPVAAIAATVAMMAVFNTAGTICTFAPARYPDLGTAVSPWLATAFRVPDGTIGLPWLQPLLILPLLVALVRNCPGPENRGLFDHWLIRSLVVAVAAGTTLAGGILFSAAFGGFLGGHPAAPDRVPEPGWFVRAVGNGYLGPDGRLGAGHLNATALLVFFLVIYAVGYHLLHPDSARPVVRTMREKVVPPLFYLLLLITIGVFSLSAFSFLLDYWRVSTLLTVGFFSYLAYRWFLCDHYFRTIPLESGDADGTAGTPDHGVRHFSGSQPLPAADPPDGGPDSTPGKRASPLEPADNRQFQIRRSRTDPVHPDREGRAGNFPSLPKQKAFAETDAVNGPDSRRRPPLVIVTGYGGGILAGAWVAQVVTGLMEKLTGFRQSIRLISGVSGGSVATLFLVDGLLNDVGGPAGRLSENINSRVRRSNLEATAWGLAYRGVLRLFLPMFFRNPVKDNGWAMERGWMQVMQTDGLTLRQVATGARKKLCPHVILNAVCVENGKRFLLSTDATQNSDGVSARRRFDFFGEYSSRDLPLVTAARISASFPFVSPIARIDSSPDRPGLHFADGGYFDNFGVFSAVEWLREHLGGGGRPRSSELQGVETVLIVRINSRAAKPVPQTALRVGWQNMLLGPLRTLIRVRGASQSERVESELELLRTWCQTVHRVRLETAYFELDHEGPLSWQLLPADERALDAEWKLYQTALDGQPVVPHELLRFGSAGERSLYWQRRLEHIRDAATTVRELFGEAQKS